MIRFITVVTSVVFVLAGLTGQARADDEYADDVQTIDSIMRAFYDVISGPAGHDYNAARDEYLHAPNAVITRITPDGTLQRHDLATEQLPMSEPYPQGFFEVELGRIVEQHEGIAQVWSTYEVRTSPDGEAVDRGLNSVSLYYHEGRWWIASWSTRLEGDTPFPARYVAQSAE